MRWVYEKVEVGMWKEDGEEWVAGALETSGRSQVLVVGDQVGEPH